MKTKLLYSTLLSIILLSTGCVKEDNMQPPSGSDATLSLNFPTQSADYGEDDITDVRIVSFIPESATTAPGVLDVNGGKKTLDDPSGRIIQTLRTGVRDVYVFVNESEDIGRELEAMSSLTDLSNIKIPYPASIAPPFFGFSFENIDITTGNTPEMYTNVVRTVSKVNMIIAYTWGPTTNLHEELVIQSVRVLNLPKYSYLIGRPYNSDDYIQSATLSGSALANTSSVPNEYKSKPLVIYVPEYLGAPDNDRQRAYVEIVGHLANSPTINCTYKIPLGELAPMSTYDIPRNTEFQIKATIESYGQMDDLSVKVTILPWNTVNQDDDTGRFINFDKVTDVANKPIVDGSNLDDMGATLKVSCNTNIGGWYTVTRDMNNMIVHKSSPTASVSVATSQTVEVTIPAIAEAVFGQNYTINIYHPTIAMESVGPVKSLNFIQYGGFIPSSVLAQSFESLNNVTIQGWPTDRLPARGLQIAKRGDQILPSGVAQADDPLKQWKTSDTSTSGTAAVGVGMGKHSTDAMIAAGADEHPAAKYCREMGPEWYLPSRDELLLIYNYKAALGTSYTFYAIEYWSATESRIYTSWYVHFYNGYTDSFDKTGNVRVRCVREI